MRHPSITTRASALWAKGGGQFIVSLVVFLAVAAPSVVAIVVSGASWSD